VQFFENRSLSGFVTVFQHALDDTTAVWMHRKCLHLTFERLDDELNMFSWNPLDRLLDNVVAVLVFHTLQHMAIELFDQDGLLFGQYVFKCLSKVSVFHSCSGLVEQYLLNNTAAVHLQRQGQDMTFHLLCQDALLQLVPVFKEFLDHIVSKNVGHKLEGVLPNLGKDNLFLVAVRRFELLLDEAGAVLVSTELNNVLVDIL
jgi:hypothetical protein